MYISTCLVIGVMPYYFAPLLDGAPPVNASLTSKFASVHAH